MLTGAFTAGRMAAPEYLSRRNRVNFTTDHLAVTHASANPLSRLDRSEPSQRQRMTVTRPIADLTSPAMMGRTLWTVQAGRPLSVSVPRSDVTDA